MSEQIVKWVLVALLVTSSISLIVVFQLDYTAEALTARAVPLAIVAGLSSIAASILFRK